MQTLSVPGIVKASLLISGLVGASTRDGGVAVDTRAPGGSEVVPGCVVTADGLRLTPESEFCVSAYAAEIPLGISGAAGQAAAPSRRAL